MKGKIEVHEEKRGLVYRGIVSFGEKNFFWLLVFMVHIDDMDKEVKRRKVKMQPGGNPEVRDELMTLLVLDNKFSEVNMGDFRHGLFREITGKVIDYYQNGVLEIYSKLINGGSMPFSISHPFEIDEKFLPDFIKT